MTDTPSLRRRVVLGVSVLLATLLILLGIAIDVLLGVQARRGLHDQLVATATRADALALARTAPDQLAAQLAGGGIRALLVTADGATYGDQAISPDITEGPGSPLPPPPKKPATPAPADASSTDPSPGAPGRKKPKPDATATVVVHALPTGGRVILVADTSQLTRVILQLREIMVVAGVVTLALAAGLSLIVSRRALTPLDRLTSLARGITSGDRGRRLRPTRDDTELGRAAAAFDEMLNALEAAERSARDAAATAQRAEARTRAFLADAAHELRTPLAGIQATAEHLAARMDPDPGRDGDRQIRRAQLLLSESRRASRLVADMLDLSRIDAGLPLDVREVDLGELVAGQIDRVAVLGPELVITRTGPDSLRVPADPGRVAQIVTNVLDNARRHTPPRGRIIADLAECADPGGVATITITDSGPGIPDADRERIFDRLVRLDDARHRDDGGAGLGLCIARALARAHGGDLVCLPHTGGARFQLTLPLAPGVRQR